MSAYPALQTGYMGGSRAMGTPREIEYHLFSQVTGRLRQTSQDGVPFSELAEALVDNQTLWRTIATDVADESNGLPEKLRAQLFYLFEFTNAHTSKVLQRQADVTPLIEVNTTIMGGLRPVNPGKGSD
ncbi:MAG: flagellar biosynthesis regulator FlaF [Pseudomonadota bacterium]